MDQFVKDVTVAVASTPQLCPTSSSQASADAVVELKSIELAMVGGGLVSPCFA